MLERRRELLSRPAGAGLVLYPNSLRALGSVSPEARTIVAARAARVHQTKVMIAATLTHSLTRPLTRSLTRSLARSLVQVIVDMITNISLRSNINMN